MQCKKLFLSCTVIFVLFSFSLFSSVGASSVMWSQTYGGEAGEYSRSLVETADGGYALAGWIESSLGRETDFWLVKTDSQGTIEWNQTYGGTNSEKAHCVVQTSDGGYALAGYTNSFGAGNYDFWLVKTDAEGNMQWNKTYGGPESEDAYSLIETSDGGFVLAGETASVGAADYDFWLIKTDENGVMEWNHTYGGTDSDQAYSLVKTSDGGIVIAGYTNSFGAGNYDFWLVKTDANGNMQWNQTYGGANWDEARSVVQTNDGGYALCGMTASFGAGSNDFWLVKTDADGNMQWNQTYGGVDYEKAHSLIETSDGGYALAGYISYSSFITDFLLVKTDANGNMEWTQTYGEEEDWDAAYCLVETSDGGYALTGETLPVTEAVDFLLIKTDELGNIPEFPSWTVMLVMLSVLVVAVAIYKRRLRPQTN